MKTNFFYAPDDGATGSAPETPPTVPASIDPPQPAQIAKYTDKDLNDRAAAARREANEKVWKKHGFSSEKDFDDYLKGKRDEDEARKTESQRLKDEGDAHKKAADEARAEAMMARAEAEAMKVGVDPQKVERFVKIAMTYPGETSAEKIAATMKDFPTEFLPSSAPAPKGAPSFGAPTKSQGSDGMEAARADLREAMGMSKKT